MTTDLSFVHLVLGASPVVQGVLLLLLIVSIASWYLIFRKAWTFKAARRGSEAFESRFWSGGDLTELYTRLKDRDDDASGLENVFVAGFKEFARLRKQAVGADSVVAGAQRAMRVAVSREVEVLQGQLPFLATVGSTSPYVGLFGTVWGIMNAFRALSDVHQATLAMVAPGIAEALIATAMGLFAAIPAVVAYNRYVNDADRIGNRYDNFVEEFSVILQRQAHAPAGS